MNFEPRTLKFDIICLGAFFVLAILCFFNVFLPIKIFFFVASLITLIYFGIYRNHNYTEEAFKNQGRLDINKGRVISNLDITEQINHEGLKEVEE